MSRVSYFGLSRGLRCGFGGYTLVGGHLGALYQPAEFLIIAGAVLAHLLWEITVKQ